ncbi:uncharacterized protein LOC106136400 isoform X2 [Amyelois transitella]|nr:uncharacterized protein LOC106136400 isoform X2 [Amyelois transitella]XP_013192396.1 uncharacterized protein LOC106136400 isoform X2 [Amyelois transitella]
MASTLFFVVLIYSTSVMAALPSYPVYLLPEHRSNVRPPANTERISTSSYDFQIVPSDQYPVTEYINPPETSLIEIISYPITALTTVASKALSVGKWIIVNGAMVFLGMALVIGFCAFTPYCTLIIEKPLSAEFRDFSIPYLDDIEYYFTQAYNKYKSMQNSL